MNIRKLLAIVAATVALAIMTASIETANQVLAQGQSSSNNCVGKGFAAFAGQSQAVGEVTSSNAQSHPGAVASHISSFRQNNC